MNIPISSCRVTKYNVLELLQNGVISCVLSQDWRVNRIVPEFIDKAHFRSILASNNKILHLGIGNGECYKYFDKKCCQFSISDKLYIDLYDIILLYLKRCNSSVKEIEFLAGIMRDEYLIAISVEKLYKGNENAFYKKDYTIYEMLKAEFCQMSNYSYSYSVILLLIHILNSIPSLLLPSVPIKRSVTPMGKHIAEQKISLSPLLAKSWFNAFITIEDVEDIALRYFSDINEIYLSKFENITLSNNMYFDYILASRSDAFLKEKYIEFVLGISKNISKDGFYISDGILCSYSYEIFYNSLDNIFKQIGADRVYFTKAKSISTSFPPQEISGIIIMGEDADINKVHSFISPSRLISAHQILNSESFLRQCIWTDLFNWASHKGIDLEEYHFDSISNILHNYIELKRTDIHSYIEFDNDVLFVKEFNST